MRFELIMHSCCKPSFHCCSFVCQLCFCFVSFIYRFVFKPKDIIPSVVVVCALYVCISSAHPFINFQNSPNIENENNDTIEFRFFDDFVFIAKTKSAKTKNHLYHHFRFQSIHVYNISLPKINFIFMTNSYKFKSVLNFLRFCRP